MGCVDSCLPRALLLKPLHRQKSILQYQTNLVEQLKQRLSFPFVRELESSRVNCGLVDVCFSVIQSFLGTPPRFRIITYEDDPFTWNFSARMSYASRQFFLKGHKDYVIVVATRGHLVVTGSNDETAKVWDAGSGVLRQTLRCGSAVSAIEIDNDTIATGTRAGVVQCWKQGMPTAEFAELWFGETGATLLAMALRSDILLTGGRDALVRVWNTKLGILQQVFQMHRCAIWAVALHINVNLATSASGDGCVYLWNTFHGKVVHKLDPGLAGYGSQFLTSWTNAGSWTQSFLQWIDPCVVVDMAGEFIVTGSVHGVVRVWNRKSGALIRTLTRGKYMSQLGSRNALVVRADGSVISCWKSGRVDVWDAVGNLPQFTITSGFPSSKHTAQSYAIALLV